MSEYNTGQIIGRAWNHGEAEIVRKTTMYDVARKREREVIAKKRLARAIPADADAPCVES